MRRNRKGQRDRPRAKSVRRRVIAALYGVTKEHESLSNNRGNNRRRSRGGNRSQGNNQFPNRIDSRARGNAPQLLDKYKKLANDAQMNGDRVQAEYYLQFADHYFRVLADNKARQDEQRAKRDDNRDDSRGGRHGSDDDDDDRQAEQKNDRSDDDQDDRPKRPRRPRKSEGQDATQGREQSEGAEADGDENPFVRQRKPAKPKGNGKAAKSAKDDGSGGLDPSALPPAIGDDANDSPKPRRRTRRAVSKDGDDGAEAAA